MTFYFTVTITPFMPDGSKTSRTAFLNFLKEKLNVAVNSISRTKIEVIDSGIDWKEACMKIIDGVGTAEGIDFRDLWDMPEIDRMFIVGEYEKWYKEKKEKSS